MRVGIAWKNCAQCILGGIGEGRQVTYMSGEGKGGAMAGDKLTIADAEKRRVPCEVYSRVVGFLRPVQYWNDGKKSEWEDRVTFALPARDKMLDVVTRVEAAKPEPEPGGFWLPDDWNEAALKLPGVGDERQAHLDQ